MLQFLRHFDQKNGAFQCKVLRVTGLTYTRGMIRFPNSAGLTQLTPFGVNFTYSLLKKFKQSFIIVLSVKNSYLLLLLQ